MEFYRLSENKSRSLYITGYYFLPFENYIMRPHRHLSYEIMLVEESECNIEILSGQDLSVKTVLCLGRGEAVFFDSGCAHALLTIADVKCKICHIEFNAPPAAEQSAVPVYQKLCENLCRALDEKGYCVVNDSASVKSAIMRIHAEMSERSVYDRKQHAEMIHNMLMQTLILFDRLIPKQRKANYTHVKNALKYIDLHYNGPLTVSQIAQAVHINEIYLERIFKAQTGKTILTYLRQCRIEKAINLIKTTPYSLTDIAFECGFESRMTFFNAFKKITGAGPKEFRKSLTDLESWL